MKLVSVLVLLALAQGAALAFMPSGGVAAISVAIILGIFQLAAIGYFRSSLPVKGLASIKLRLPFRVLSVWSLFTVAGAGILQSASYCFWPEDLVQEANIRQYSAHWTGWLLIVFVTPLVEEIVFNACVFELLRSKLSTALALVASATLFGLMHGNLEALPLYMFWGVVSGVAYVRSGSILPGYVGHAALNAYGLASVSTLFT